MPGDTKGPSEELEAVHQASSGVIGSIVIQRPGTLEANSGSHFPLQLILLYHIFMPIARYIF